MQVAKAPIWAVAPVVNLSGQSGLDPLLEADLLYQQLQQVKGMVVIPVDRVVQVQQSMGLREISNARQAADIAKAVGADGLVMATVTAWYPYMPPRMAASLEYIPATGSGTPNREMQAVGMFDANAGSVQKLLADYAVGRVNPNGPYAEKEFTVSMDRYSGFVYWQLLSQLIAQRYQPAAPVGTGTATTMPALQNGTAQPVGSAPSGPR